MKDASKGVDVTKFLDALDTLATTLKR